jgi:hypothetical protein
MPRYAKFDDVFRESDAYTEVVCGYLNDHSIDAYISAPDEIVVSQVIPESHRIEDAPAYHQWHVRVRNEIIEVLICDAGGSCQVMQSFELCHPDSLDDLVKWFATPQI